MTISYRTVLAGVSWLAGMAFMFFPGDRNLAAVLAGGACFAISIALQPNGWREYAERERGPSITWDQRDAGEKFSIAMAYVLMAGFALGAALLLAGLGEAAPVALWRIALAAALVTAVGWKFWRNWKNRNAG